MWTIGGTSMAKFLFTYFAFNAIDEIVLARLYIRRVDITTDRAFRRHSSREVKMNTMIMKMLVNKVLNDAKLEKCDECDILIRCQVNRSCVCFEPLKSECCLRSDTNCS